KVNRYLAAPTIHTQDPLGWWWEHRPEYPHLSHMALSYLTIPGTSVNVEPINVERVFSSGQLLLPHICNGLSAHSIHALLCLSDWS
ncbi:hypothetical protein K466DRAFT_454575, partial [Polyporus arcularius HHB13444]